MLFISGRNRARLPSPRRAFHSSRIWSLPLLPGTTPAPHRRTRQSQARSRTTQMDFTLSSSNIRRAMGLWQSNLHGTTARPSPPVISPGPMLHSSLAHLAEAVLFHAAGVRPKPIRCHLSAREALLLGLTQPQQFRRGNGCRILNNHPSI